jgi:predicted glycosyltransferase
MAIRRWLAARKRGGVSREWPIAPGSERPPAWWRGWPGGKQFALVLTHDVEGQAGLDKAAQLKRLETELGFRSSFNLIPRGSYRVTPQIVQDLASGGFEVGVHDLFHDGKLFLTETEFSRNVPEINRHLKEWNAVGFRSGFMLSRLDWLHQLDIQYDLSTFDTDPFEPNPQGQDTIFPFWVPRTHRAGHYGPHARTTAQPEATQNGNGKGYVELPYTLAQDSTLFLLLRETDTTIWKKKLDWIAAHGGMALVNVHPDYMAMNGTLRPGLEYPVSFYAELLQYIRERYAGLYWHALPQQVARHVAEAQVTGNGVNPRGQAMAARPRRSRPKIWIDLDNTPHVPLFEPILEELKERGYPVLVTARDAFQVCDLAEHKGLACVRVGRHYGKHRLLKGFGLAYRAAQLAPVILRERPAVALSHGARSQLLLATLLRRPRILMEDYEFCEFPPLMRPSWLLTPEAIRDEALGLDPGCISKYRGIKEDIYAWKLKPDAGILDELGIGRGQIVVTVRPPATEAHYHNPESEQLFERLMDRASQTSGVRVVLLPRNDKQGRAMRVARPDWFAPGKAVVPGRALDGLNLIWHSDLVVSGGGTMNREAAALGVPVYSIFRGKTGAVDRYLAAEGRLKLLTSSEEVERLVQFVKRPERSIADATSRKALSEVVDLIEQAIERLLG